MVMWHIYQQMDCLQNRGCIFLVAVKILLVLPFSKLHQKQWFMSCVAHKIKTVHQEYENHVPTYLYPNSVFPTASSSLV